MRSQGYRTTFSCGDRIALTSRKREDFEWFSLHDPCLLVYIGREKPVRSSSSPTGCCFFFYADPDFMQIQT